MVGGKGKMGYDGCLSVLTSTFTACWCIEFNRFLRMGLWMCKLLSFVIECSSMAPLTLTPIFLWDLFTILCV